MGKVAFDHSTMAGAFGHAGIDPRVHITWGLVAKGDENTPAVEFDTEDGQVYVNVVTQPGKLNVRCRLAGGLAGNGEGEFFPFLENDECIIAIPEGDERAGCTIIGRMNNAYDKFPTDVAGADPKLNNFAFRRMRTPYIVETASSYMIRSALTKSFWSIDTAGNLTFSDGNSNMIHVGADFIGMASGDNVVMLQLDLHKNQVIAEANGSKFVIDGDTSTFNTSGTLELATAGGFGSGHAVTLEQVVNLFINFIYALNTLGGPIATALTGPTGPLFAATFPANLITFLTTWLQSSAAPTPATPVLGGGVFLPAIPALITTAIASSAPLSSIDPTGLIPGVGRGGLKF